MSLAVAILGSSSSGNASLLRIGPPGSAQHVLVDAGFSPRRTARLLEHYGLEPSDLSHVLLTHLDNDHCHRGWGKAFTKLKATVVIHRHHQRAAVRAGLPVARLRIVDGGFDLGAGASVEPVVCAHDQLGSIGFVIETRGRRLGWATDLGRVPTAMRERFVDLDAIAIESNYDRQMQIRSYRPAQLKTRVMGGQGHLSNDQALALVRAIDERRRLDRVILLHLSRDCNAPDIVRRLYAIEAPHLAPRVTIAHPDRPTPFLEVMRRPEVEVRPLRVEQLGLWG